MTIQRCFCLMLGPSQLQLFRAVLLSGYEPDEPVVSISTPDLTASAEIVRDGGDIPYPVDGDYMLRLSWTNETDRKVEVKHQWQNLYFSLMGYERILADVYIPDSVMPGLIGIWDSVFGWHPAITSVCSNGDMEDLLKLADGWVAGFNMTDFSCISDAWMKFN